MKHKFHIIGVVMSIALMACTPKATEGPIVPNDVLPKELVDCQFFTLQDSAGSITRVARCPKKEDKTLVGGLPVQPSAITNSPEQECINGELHKISLAPNNSLVATVYTKNGQPISCKK